MPWAGGNPGQERRGGSKDGNASVFKVLLETLRMEHLGMTTLKRQHGSCSGGRARESQQRLCWDGAEPEEDLRPLREDADVWR